MNTLDGEGVLVELLQVRERPLAAALFLRLGLRQQLVHALVMRINRIDATLL